MTSLENWAFIQSAAIPYLDRFLATLSNPVGIQKQLLQTLLFANQETVFGRNYRFASIGSYEEFCDRVPLQTYEDLSPYIQRIVAGEQGVLTAEPTIVFEMTGGSTQGPKLIPYTATGLDAFRQAILPSLADLLQHRPKIKLGRTYWAISPVTRPPTQTSSGIPIGLPNDAAYFGEELAACIAELLAVSPAAVSHLEMQEWRYLTALLLLTAEDLGLISVWSPTFLLQTIEVMQQERDRIFRAIAEGWGNIPANPTRARVLETAFSHSVPDTERIWPQLDTISCWTDATAKAFIPQLQTLFPKAFIQGKGLLATEGAVTLPLMDYTTPVLAIQSGVYEFIDDEDRACLCDRLVEDRVYRLAIATHSGLYRYDTGDRVRVRGWKAQTPLLEFVGRAGLVSDLCGEKISEDFVLHQFDRCDKRPGFAMLAPSLQGTPHYVLFLDAEVENEAAAIAFCQRLERALARNPQYEYARQLGQLGALCAQRVHNPLARYIDRALQRGQRLGDIKPPSLRLETDWETFFKAEGRGQEAEGR